MIDWRSSCSDIRYQGNCGSCTAFGIIGAWEALLRIYQDEDADLSEQNLFMCAGGSCDYGSYMEPVLDQAVKGVPTEECCPYVARNTNCSDRCEEWWTDAKKLKSYVLLAKTINAFKQALEEGPIVATMAVPQSFLSYKSGVYHKLPYDPIVGYHCIALVGYDDEKGAWLLRNSWNTSWGIEGYCWIRYGECDIEQEAYWIELNGEVEPNDGDDDSGCVLSNLIVNGLNWLSEKLGRKTRFRAFLS